jgi:ParB-like chromosome segregation protein Spo0J
MTQRITSTAELLDVAALPVYPAAQVWPMLIDSELDALAQSIAETGLLHPVVVWCDDEGEWWLLDGRNRLAACERAGVTPEYEVYDGDDPAMYVLAANDFRRHASPSQRAMAVALTVTTKRGRPEKDANLRLNDEQVAVKAGVSERLITSCRYVRDHAPQLIDAVLAGTIRAAAAEAEAKRLFAEAQRLTEEKARKALQAITDRDKLTRQAPDLAEQFFDEDGADPEDIAGEYQARVDQSCIAVSQWNQAITQIRDACRALSKIDGDDVPTILEMAATQGKTVAVGDDTLETMSVTATKLEEMF